MSCLFCENDFPSAGLHFDGNKDPRTVWQETATLENYTEHRANGEMRRYDTIRYDTILYDTILIIINN